MAKISDKAQQELASIRDTVESIWVAIVLAFVLRAFVVEAFVIPTGSMAPRLFGEHLDLQCPDCGYEYAFGWSAEPHHRQAGPYGGYAPPRRSRANGRKIPAGAKCPHCGYDQPGAQFVAGGDRVLVMKYLYRFREPEPWDVVVFKNPQDNRQNYIKRLIGLPGEEIEIVHGDIFVRRAGEGTFQIRRKDDPKVQEAMWHVVFDNDYPPSRPARLSPDEGAAGSNRLAYPVWEPADDLAKSRWVRGELGGRRFRFKGCDAGRQAELELHSRVGTFLPRYGYNATLDVDREIDVVSDLKLVATYCPEARDSRLILTLSSFEHVFRGELGADGVARLLYRRTEDGPSVAWTPLAPERRLGPLKADWGHKVALEHVDFRVRLSVDGQTVLVSRERTADTPAADRTRYPVDYRLLKERLRAARAATGRRPIPQPLVRIGASGGPCRLRHMKLLRDVYYTSPVFREGPGEGSEGKFARSIGLRKGDPGWGVDGHPIALERYPGRPDLDQFFVLGDNSPSSLDGRLWSSAAVTLRLYDESGVYGNPRLAVGDVAWGPFVQELRRRARGAGSPGEQVWLRLPVALRDALGRLSPDDLRDGYIGDDVKHAVVGKLNDMIAGGPLFAPGTLAAAGVELPARARDLAGKATGGGKLSPRDTRDLNRLALEAVFRGSITGRRRTYQLGTVPRYSLIGKAIFVYWPAGFRIPGLSALPILPNAGRMRLIR